MNQPTAAAMRAAQAIADISGLNGENGGYEVMAEIIDAEIRPLLEACEAFVTAWEKSHQLEKTEVALRMARAAIAKAEGRE